MGADNRTFSKKVFIETYGCQMNEYDTELVRSILAKAKYALVPSEEEADVVLLNTCAVREHAHQKVYNRIHEIKRGHNGSPVMIGILGCMATNLRTDLLENRRLKIDFIAGPDSYKRLPQLIDEAAKTEVRGREVRGKKQEVRRVFDITLSEFETYSDVYPRRERGVNAWLAVMRGCNNFCTFCVVPYTRGRERSRTIENVVEETRHLANDGFKQVTLLGQNVNSYYAEGKDFADLLEAVSEVKGIERVRFTSPHPKDFPDKLLEAVARNPKVCKHVHLPLQSGSNRILELMDRTYTKEEFLALVEKVRGLIPGVALSTDVIVGFCSETDADFAQTLDVMERVGFDSAFTFKYSQRKGTIAERKFKDDVPEAVKTERIVRLNELQKEISLKKNRAHIGKTFEILLENKGSKRSPEVLYGRADGNQLVTLDGGGWALGESVKVRVIDASPNVLKGVAIL
ncbi:MAG TPA: tRNA (N6-isopentenyl adenosine(37)-C2)-methylthiotransferase MiaB [Candidatus Omnitrophica bacterium]|nr:MAG: tRNA (N6-isopentenyl adenosine(37)-C2)-methylthiotransferase MiaB [Omnitrophica WOR_2 bacterium GWA2_53_43]HBO96527.1 tRNA (N6-isopentenyl adenosine(37)-C2)-methylthiotransferase MiaB [Candidatus Omnitrophota bacterium]HCI44747.1 tRNA (N6-isopentenyl adenosine(37)-C2)-methylthiotransferase MiaB [Candidatus Omnitrophota bacterium]